MTHSEHILEYVLRICALDKIYDYLECINITNGLLMCNKTISEIITNKLLKSEQFTLTEMCFWNINKLAKVRRIFVNEQSNLRFFHQLFPKLELISFDKDFNYPIIEKMLPSTLKEIYFERFCKFNLKIPKNTLPNSLTKLTFGWFFNKPIDKNTLPCDLTELTFGEDFNQSIDRNVLPINLKRLEFGHDFNHSLKKGVLPNSLTQLIFGAMFNQPIVQGDLPDGITSLEFGTNFNKFIKVHTLPNSLTELIFGAGFKQPIINSIPNNLRVLHIE